MGTFWTLFAESYIMQGVLGVVFAGAIVYLSLTGRVVPDYLVNFTALILGFYFGSKVGGAVAAGRGPREE